MALTESSLSVAPEHGRECDYLQDRMQGILCLGKAGEIQKCAAKDYEGCFERCVTNARVTLHPAGHLYGTILDNIRRVVRL